MIRPNNYDVEDMFNEIQGGMVCEQIYPCLTMVFETDDDRGMDFYAEVVLQTILDLLDEDYDLTTYYVYMPPMSQIPDHPKKGVIRMYLDEWPNTYWICYLIKTIEANHPVKAIRHTLMAADLPEHAYSGQVTP